MTENEPMRHIAVTQDSIFGGAAVPVSIQSLPMAAVGGRRLWWPRFDDSSGTVFTRWLQSIESELLGSDNLAPRPYSEDARNPLKVGPDADIVLTRPGDYSRLDTDGFGDHLERARAELFESIRLKLSRCGAGRRCGVTAKMHAATLQSRTESVEPGAHWGSRTVTRPRVRQAGPSSSTARAPLL